MPDRSIVFGLIVGASMMLIGAYRLADWPAALMALGFMVFLAQIAQYVLDDLRDR
jgi:4-hydroxybenzoate polyprenyltransferase